MKIAIEGCLHGELQKVYETIHEIEERENYKVDVLLCCGDFQATRNLADLKCMAVPDKFKEMGTFYKYYSGELKAPILTFVIGGNHEASNHMQELPFGGWLCPNIYFLGNCGVVDLVDKTGEVALTIGGLSGIFKGHDYLKGRFERTPYDKSSMRSVYHVRNIDEFRLKSMPPGSVDIMLSHDWPNGITDYGNVEQLLRFKRFFADDIQNNRLGSKPAMEILKYLKPKYWFSGHLHCKFAAIYEETTRFLALDKCLPNRRFLQVIDEGANSNDAGPFTLKYNPKWLAILKSTNHLQSSSYNNQHMPGKGYAYGRCDFTPTPEEEKIVRKIFNEEFDIPENFATTTKVFNASCENVKQIFTVQDPKPQVNPQTETFCEKLGIDDPISLIDQETSSFNSGSVRKSDAYNVEDQDMTYEITKNEDEIKLDDDSDNSDEAEKTATKRFSLSLPAPKNSFIDDRTDKGDEISTKRPIDSDETEKTPTKRFSLSLPAPKNTFIDDRTDKDKTEKAEEDTNEEKEKSPQKKVLKRRNLAIYTTNDDETE